MFRRLILALALFLAPVAVIVATESPASAGTTYTYSGSCYWKRTTGYYNYTPRVAVWALNTGCWQVKAYIHYGANQPGCPAYTYTGWRLMGSTGNETVLIGQYGCGASYVDIAIDDSRGVIYAWYREWF